MKIKSKNMIITTDLLDDLTLQAKANPRLRMNYDLRTSAKDSSQRMLNALEPGTVVPIHRHPGSSETVCCVRAYFTLCRFSFSGSSDSIGSMAYCR